MPLIRATSDALVYIGKGYGAAGPQAINPAVEPLPTAEVDPGTHRDCSRRPTTAPVVPPPAPRLSPRSETWGSIVVQEGRDQSRRCFLPHNYSRPERAARSTTRGALVEGAAYRNVSRKVTCTTRRDRASRNAPVAFDRPINSGASTGIQRQTIGRFGEEPMELCRIQAFRPSHRNLSEKRLTAISGA
jgi:hypothetical protein